MSIIRLLVELGGPGKWPCQERRFHYEIHDLTSKLTQKLNQMI